MNAKQKQRLSEIPELYQANYRKAIETNSKATALKAKCLDCCCWVRKEITLCTVSDCPLWKYRPYQDKSADSSPVVPQDEGLSERTGCKPTGAEE